jgi:hypothetical protein
MTQPLKIDRDKTAVVIMDFQQRIIANNASEPENVVKQASAVLQVRPRGWHTGHLRGITPWRAIRRIRT